MKQFIAIILIIVFGLLGVFVPAAQAEQVTYRYDDMQRLTRAEYTSGLILAYTYDKAGNRLNQQARSGVMLTVNVTGSGPVTSDPTGIECRANCSEVFSPGTEVTLQAVPDEGGEFLGWSGGGCSGSDPCVLALQEYTLVNAEFVSLTTPASFLLWTQ
jgi:YD repeat-containing protein